MSSSEGNYLKSLNPPQREAAEHHEGPILVLAGAGTGKTRVLTHRIAHLVLHHGVHPGSILAVTFTNKATNEMRDRLTGLLGDRASRLWVATFHSACLRILRTHAQLLSYTNRFVVYDDNDTKAVLKSVLKELDLSEKEYPVATFRRLIDQAKNAYISAEEYGLDSTGYIDDINAQVYSRYQQKLMQSDAMDFGDLLVNTVKLLEEFPDVRRKYQQGLKQVLVDEFQDTNVVQYRLLKLLTGHYKNLFVVGDDDQSIYAFRGATIANILTFEDDYPDAVTVTLDQNYRSTSPILEISHSVISKNTTRKPKKLWTESSAGENATVYAANDETEEAQYVAGEIDQYVQDGGSLTDVAIFYRTNAQSRALEEALMDRGLTYRIFGGPKFYDRKEIKDIICYLRLIANPSDNQAFIRVINTPARGVGAQTVRKLIDHAQNNLGSLWEAARALSPELKKVAPFVKLMEEMMTLAKNAHLGHLVEEIIGRIKYEELLKKSKDLHAESRIENLHELKVLAHHYDSDTVDNEESLATFLERVSLTSSGDLPKSSDDVEQENPNEVEAVSLMTLHLAKGLEFPIVFLTGLEEGMLPHYRAMFDPIEVEEERRLCYVGITRAMQRLYMTRATWRGFLSAPGGVGVGGQYRGASRFLNDMPRDLIEFIGGDEFEEVIDYEYGDVMTGDQLARKIGYDED